MISEAIHIYGDHKNLQGIATTPETYKHKDIAVILLNAGMVRKVGPFNLNVDLARKLSSGGYFVFRFDLAGLGDSTKVNTGKTNYQNAMDDLKATMDHIDSQYNIEKFIIIGLCTGADYAHKISVLDERVVGDVWLDGYGYPTPAFLIKRITPVLFNPVRLAKSIAERVRNLFVKTHVSGVDAYVWKLPERKDYVREMKQLFQRDFKSLYLFSGGVAVYYNYKNQFRDGFQKFGFWKNIEVEHYPEFDHTYTLVDDRHVMIGRVQDWLDRNFTD